MKPNFTVYHMTASRSLRVVWLLEELELPYSVEMIGFDFGNAGGESFKKIHPLQKVPALTDGDTTMYESVAIMQYVMNMHGDGGLRPEVGDAEYASYLQWLHFGEATLMPIIVDLLKHRRFYPKEERLDPVIEKAEIQLEKQLGFLASQIGVKDYILERGFSAADISVAYCMLLLRLVGAKSLIPETVMAYWNRAIARPAWIAASKVE